MPRPGITAYDLLISCPGDVIEFLDVVRSSVENFNRVFGVINNIEIVTKHWSTHSYPQSGDKPQELLNKQIVRNCDAAIAIFWTKFGTPTDQYGSGTEEEIEEMLSAKKQVFMYFLDVPVNLSQVDTEQYNKIKLFRERYQYKGIYALIKDKNELQREFTNHLAMHFLPLITRENNNDYSILKSAIKIIGINTSGEETYNLYHMNYSNSQFIRDIKEKNIIQIRKLEEKVISDSIEIVQEEESETIKNTSLPFKNIGKQKQLGLYGVSKDAAIVTKWREVIRSFAYNNGIKLEDNFWNVGNLKSRITTIMPTFMNYEPSFEGTEDEKERYKSMEALYWNVVIYNEYIEYFSYIDKYDVAKFAVSNVGNSYDEDIVIKLVIPKGSVLMYNELPYPGINIIRDLIEMKFADFNFSIQESSTISGYEGYMPTNAYVYNMPTNPFKSISVSEEYKENKHKYKSILEDIFCYKKFEDEENDILTFHINYLKHNTSMAFPSVLFYKKIPSSINIEIASKHCPEIVKGKIEFQ